MMNLGDFHAVTKDIYHCDTSLIYQAPNKPFEKQKQTECIVRSNWNSEQHAECRLKQTNESKLQNYYEPKVVIRRRKNT